MLSEREALGSLAPSAIRASVVVAGARDLELNADVDQLLAEFPRSNLPDPSQRQDQPLTSRA